MASDGRAMTGRVFIITGGCQGAPQPDSVGIRLTLNHLIRAPRMVAKHKNSPRWVMGTCLLFAGEIQSRWGPRACFACEPCAIVLADRVMMNLGTRQCLDP